jgi:hypothetical protein
VTILARLARNGRLRRLNLVNNIDAVTKRLKILEFQSTKTRTQQFLEKHTDVELRDWWPIMGAGLDVLSKCWAKSKVSAIAIIPRKPTSPLLD